MRSLSLAPMPLTISPSSMIWRTDMRGLSEENGSWKTICMRLRSGRIALRSLPWIGWPSKKISPPWFEMSRSSACPKVVLPEPDSPTMPSVSCRLSTRSRLSQATSSKKLGRKTLPRLSVNATRTSCPSRTTGLSGASGLAVPLGSEARRCLV